jgi:fatty-acyl-CoA synthase
MHAAGQWVTMIAMFSGGTAVVYGGRKFDAGEVLDLVAREGSQTVALVGDAMAIPVAEEMENNPRELPGLFAISNGGAMLSPATRERLAAAFPGKILSDGFGSSETGAVGTGANSSPNEEGSHFSVGPKTAVLNVETLEPVVGGVAGMVARSGHIPLGYMNDEARSADVFRTDSAGTRWVLSGDWAIIEPDGRLLLLGRDSNSINSGGEKIHPEEVEAACRHHEAVDDVIVTGVPDERWGTSVAAIIQLTEHGSISLKELQDHCRGWIAGYKVPRHLVLGDVKLTNVGKPDTVWARAFACAELGLDNRRKS